MPSKEFNRRGIPAGSKRGIRLTQPFVFEELALRGARRITPFFASDERGGLIKDYHVDTFRDNGIEHPLREVFYTVSYKGVLRAIHFQLIRQQAKLVRCISGRVYDVLVDLRPESETFGQWLGFELSGENRVSLYVPERFGHGYLVLEDAVVSYQCGEVFYGKGDSGIRWNDAELGIRWPLNRIDGAQNLIISEKDRNLMSFADYRLLCGRERKA